MTLLDTHTFVWLASDQKELSAKAAAAIILNPAVEGANLIERAYFGR